MLEGIPKLNKKFVENRGYEKYITDKYPDKKITILSRMDTRLTELLLAASEAHNGDVKVIKNVGAVIPHPFDGVVRSLLVAIIELGVEEIVVIAHSDCGACHMDSDEVITRMKERGIKSETIDMIHYCSIDFSSWLEGSDDPAESVKEVVHSIENYPLVPRDVRVYGFITDSLTSELTRVE